MVIRKSNPWKYYNRDPIEWFITTVRSHCLIHTVWIIRDFDLWFTKYESRAKKSITITYWTGIINNLNYILIYYFHSKHVTCSMNFVKMSSLILEFISPINIKWVWMLNSAGYREFSQPSNQSSHPYSIKKWETTDESWLRVEVHFFETTTRHLRSKKDLRKILFMRTSKSRQPSAEGQVQNNQFWIDHEFR